MRRREEKNERKERESVCVVGRTFWFVARLLDAFLPAHYRRDDDDDDTTRLDERDDFLCGMNFFLFFGPKKMSEIKRPIYETLHCGSVKKGVVVFFDS